MGTRAGWLRSPRVWAATGLVAALVLAAACGAGGGDSDDEEEERPASAAPRVTTEGGEAVVTFDPGTLARSGVVVRKLVASTHQPAATAYGAVLDITGLAGARGAVAAAQAAVERAHASLVASRAELTRVTRLNADRQSVSEKTVETARAAFQRDDADASAAEQALAAQLAGAVQHWGTVLAGWLEHGSPDLAALLAEKRRLLQLSLPLGVNLAAAPAKARVETGGGATVEAHLLGRAPRADPLMQGESLLFEAPATPSLLPGARVAANLPLAAPRSGVLVPTSAVVWWHGKAWVYLEKTTGKFVRREVPTDVPLPGGWFATGGLAAGDGVVVEGAQTLLSEEGRAAIHGSEG
jgi:hypothetical protein